MNERIKKLSDEAYVYASEKNSIYSPQLLRDYTERFAELIVRECARFADKGTRGGMGELMKQHFGVEE